MTSLPVRFGPRPGQGIDDWLEHVAEANAMTTGHLTALLRSFGSTRFLVIRPEQATADAIVALTGQARSDVERSTLARFDATGVVNLNGFDPRRWSTWRKVAARGWVHATGSAVCPRCLATDGVWRLTWRLPTVTVCPRHAYYLREQCPGCGRRFLDHPHTPLRSAPGTRCLNPVGHKSACDVDVATIQTIAAPDDCVRRQRRHDAALEGERIELLGRAEPGVIYLESARMLAVLLLHLAAQNSGSTDEPWSVRARTEAASGRTRWHLSPPEDIVVRSQVLTCADRILTAPDLDTAAGLLTPWVERAPHGEGSRLGWLADHTRMTPTLTALVMAALAPQRRVSHALNHTRGDIRPETIPQVVPDHPYRAHAAHLFTTHGETSRLFLALCLARQTGPTTWAEAALRLGIEAELGTRTARTVSARNSIRPQRLLPALDQLACSLGPNYRVREELVRRLAEPHAWFEDWADEHRPGTRPSSHRYAVTWLWEHWAHALVSTSPGWRTPPDRHQRALYRQFAHSLHDPAGAALLAVAHHGIQEEPHDHQSHG